MTKKDIDKIQKSLEEIIADMGIDVQIKIEAAKEEKEDESLQIQIESSQAAALIGFHGETLYSLQIIISYLVHKVTKKWIKVVVNIGDYLQKREEQLKKLALNLAMKAKFSQEEQVVSNLNASERRIIHLALADRSDVYTVSEGDGRQRQLTIKPKTLQ